MKSISHNSFRYFRNIYTMKDTIDTVIRPISLYKNKAYDRVILSLYSSQYYKHKLSSYQFRDKLNFKNQLHFHKSDKGYGLSEIAEGYDE